MDDIPVAKNECKPLLELIELIGEAEWRKGTASEYVAREKGKWVLRKQTQYPPSVSFRFKNEKSETVSRLKRAIEGYVGCISWTLTKHKRVDLPGTNWTIEPARLWEIKDKAKELGVTPKQYIAKYEPGFGPVAFEDLSGLIEYLRNEFNVLG
ncbi:hypothetical protein [Microbulbifer sp. JSM ZJ756]|uniref:hypothetical protein n=1 Tax=Microbulbifer sp. JSM ZJ756 TaxID=3376191 RepID=UPI0037B2DF32